MDLVEQYRQTRRAQELGRLRRAMALRAMIASGMSQRAVAAALGVSQSAVSQQIKSAPRFDRIHPEILLEAARPILTVLAEQRGYQRLAVFGSVAGKRARADSDIDLIVAAPAGTSTFQFLRFKKLIEAVLGRDVDLVDYDGLKPRLDDDIRREAVLL